MLAAQKQAIETVAPGVRHDEIHRTAMRSLVESMISCGLLQGTVDECITSEAYKSFYMHNTSHWLGLDVHDAGAYRVGAEPRRLEPGMVFTVEPGLYVAADDAEADPRFRGLGVRIEDDVAVTPDGCENLTHAVPKRLDELEALAAER